MKLGPSTVSRPNDVSRYSAISSEPVPLNMSLREAGSIQNEPRIPTVNKNDKSMDARLDSELKGKINQHQSIESQRQQMSQNSQQNSSNRKSKRNNQYEHINQQPNIADIEHELARQAYQMSSNSKKSDRNVQRNLQGSQQEVSDFNRQRKIPASGSSPAKDSYSNEMSNEKNKEELIKQFGEEKGQEYYGAIRELEEFLDPNVLQDQEFEVRRQTKQRSDFISSNIDHQQMNQMDNSQLTTDLLNDSSMVVKAAGSQRYHDSILGPVTQSEIQFNDKSGNYKASTGYESKIDDTMLESEQIHQTQMIYSQNQVDPYANLSHDDRQASQGIFKTNDQVSSQQHQVNQWSQDNNELDNTHSDTVGMGSVGAFHSNNLQNYVNMELGPPTSLDHFYPNPVPQQFKNPLALAPIKPKKATSKGKSKQGKRQHRMEAGLVSVSHTHEEKQMANLRKMSTNGGRRLMDHTQGSPRTRALPVHIYGQPQGLKEAKQVYYQEQNTNNNRANTNKIPQRNNMNKLIYDQQRSHMVNPISQSTGMELKQQPSWNSRLNEEQQVYMKLQEQRTSNQSSSIANGPINNSQSSIQPNAMRVNEKFALSNGTQNNQPNENENTLPSISSRQNQIESRNQKLDNSIARPQNVYHEVRQINDTTGRKINGSGTPTTLVQMGSFANETHLTPIAKKAIYKPINQNMSFQNNERRYMSNGRDPMYVKKGGFYLNQPSSGTGKIILKKINHYFDNKKINKLYRNNSRRRGDNQWRTEHVNRNLYRALPNDVANVDLSKVRRGSGYESNERKSANNNARYTNRSNKSRMESGANSRTRKKDILDNAIIQPQFQQTPRSPIKKGSKKPQYQIVGEKVNKGGRYSREAAHDSITNKTSLGTAHIRQSMNHNADRLASQELPEQKVSTMHRIPQTQQVKKRATVGAEEMKTAMRECGTPEVMENIDNNYDYAESQTGSQVRNSRGFVHRRTSEPPNMLYDRKYRNQQQRIGSHGGNIIEYGQQSDSLNYTVNNTSQDQQVNISIRNRVQNQIQKRPSPKLNKKNLLYSMEQGPQISSTRNKALNKASKQTMKRPFYNNDGTGSTVPNLKSMAQYSQTLPRHVVPTHQLTKKEKMLQQNISRKSKLESTQKVLYQNSRHFEAQLPASQYQSQGRINYIPPESTSSKNYELVKFKNKKGSLSKRRSSNQGSRKESRKRSTSRRDLKSKGEVTRSVPNNSGINRLIQSKQGPIKSNMGAKATLDTNYNYQKSNSRSRSRDKQLVRDKSRSKSRDKQLVIDKQLVGNRSFNIPPNGILQSERSNYQQNNDKKAILTITRNASRLSGIQPLRKEKQDTTSMPPEIRRNESAFNNEKNKIKSIMRQPGEGSRETLKQRSELERRKDGAFPAKVSLPSNSSFSKAGLAYAVLGAPHATLNKSNKSQKSKNSQSRIDSPDAGSEYSRQNSDVMTEVNKSLKKQKQSHRQMKNMDKDHLEQIKSIQGARNKSLYVPEGLSADPKLALDMISVNTKKTGGQDSSFPTRTGSAQNQMRKGLEYKFTLKDLDKYSKKLRYKDINWKLKLTALGKVIPDMKTRKKILMKGSHFNKLLKDMKATDWGVTPIYHQYLRNGRWKHEDDNIYSEIELQYYISYLNQIDSKEKELHAEDVKAILDKYYKKTMHTLEVLMNQMNMNYYLERVRLMFADVEPTVSQLAKIMSRCLKMYQQMDQFIRIFKLIDKNNKLALQGKKDETLIKRLISAIKLLLREHPVLPVSFVFKGQDVLEQLRKTQVEMGIEVEEDPFPSPQKQRSKSRKRRETEVEKKKQNADFDEKDPLNKTFTSMNSKDLGAISPDMREHSRILDTESVADSLMTGM